ncbi:MAG: thermonuclease family protein, partial [Hyphomicrobiales bacterium]
IDHMKWVFSPALIVPALLVSPALAGTIVLKPGAYEVKSARSIAFDGRLIHLSGIDAPAPGHMCTLRGKERDCGAIARSQLIDLTVAATIKCNINGGTASCTAGGFDISAQMVYTGWAVPGKGAPEKYSELMIDAKSKQRGLWRAELTPPWPPGSQ